MNEPIVSVAVEGDADEALARRIIDECSLTPGVVYVQHGKGKLDLKLNAFNRAAAYAPWFVLRDLDQDADCAPTLRSTLIPNCTQGMVFRIAVRATEAWLLADRTRISRFLGVALNKIPVNPDHLEQPKLTMVNLARRSRKRQIREDMVPMANPTASVGPAYVSRIIEFAHDHWSPIEAAEFSTSLRKCIAALDKLRQTHLPIQ